MGYNAHVLVLSIDTCDVRGSVALLREETVLVLLAHVKREEYSSWLLPAVSEILKKSGFGMSDVGGYAVAAGPGSFTGVRVGLTTAKTGAGEYVASFADAQRGQVFGALFQRAGSEVMRVGEEMVIAPSKFVEVAVASACGERMAWVSPDAGLVVSEPAWRDRERRGEKAEQVSATLAGIIGRIGFRRLQEGRTTDALGLDANYVRRSDAEIFWKGGAAHGH